MCSNVKGSTLFHWYNANAADVETCLKFALALPAYSCPEIADSGLSYKGAGVGGRPRVIVFISLRDTPPAHQNVPLGPPWQTCQDPRTPHPTVSRGTSHAHGTQPGKARTALPALSVLAPGPLRVDRRHGAVGWWWLALCRRALGATWSCGRGRPSFSCVVCFLFRCRRRCRKSSHDMT